MSTGSDASPPGPREDEAPATRGNEGIAGVLAADPVLPPAQEDPDALLPVEPSYKNVIRARLALVWLPLVLGSLVLERALEGSLIYGLPSTLMTLLALIVLVIAPKRVYNHLRYRVAARHLQVLRGWMFHTDTVVPLVRVQHIDVTRGPLDKLFGTASLVVHTAGTHNSIVTVPGVSPGRAEEIRDLIREHVRTDLD